MTCFGAEWGFKVRAYLVSNWIMLNGSVHDWIILKQPFVFCIVETYKQSQGKTVSEEDAGNITVEVYRWRVSRSCQHILRLSVASHISESIDLPICWICWIDWFKPGTYWNLCGCIGPWRFCIEKAIASIISWNTWVPFVKNEFMRLLHEVSYYIKQLNDYCWRCPRLLQQTIIPSSCLQRYPSSLHQPAAAHKCISAYLPFFKQKKRRGQIQFPPCFCSWIFWC